MHIIAPKLTKHKCKEVRFHVATIAKKTSCAKFFHNALDVVQKFFTMTVIESTNKVDSMKSLR